MVGDAWRGHQVPTRLGPGSRIADYVLEGRIGAGGMAVVFRARDEVLGRLVAVKVLVPPLADDPDFRVRFLRESRAIAAVDELHILPVYAAGESAGVLYIATRFVAGGDLARLLRRSGGTLSFERTAALITQVAAALDAAHAVGLVHRDVKPGNVLIDTVPGRPEHCFLSDFGLTKADSSMTGLTAAGSFVGTADYCAPEQINGWKVTGRGDQYALGCVAFQLLTGTVPFPRTNILATLYAHVNEPSPAASAILAGLPPDVDAVLARSLAKRPEARYASCGEFAAALRAALLSARPLGAPLAAASLDADTWAAYPEAAGVDERAWVPPSAISVPPADLSPIGRDDPALTSSTGTALAPDGGRPFPPRAPGHRGAHSKPAAKSRRAKGLIAASVVAVLGVGAWAGFTLPGQGHGRPAAAVAAATAHLAATLTAPGGAEFSLDPVMSADGRYIAAAGGTSANQSSVYVWDATTGNLLSKLSLPAGGIAQPFAFTSDDKALVANFYTPAAKQNTVYRVILSTGQRTAIGTFPVSLNASVSGDGSTLAVENPAGTGINMRKLSGVTSLVPFLKNPRVGSALVPNSLQLDDSGDEVIFSDTKGTAYVISTTTGAVSSVGFHYTAHGAFPLLTPDGSMVLVPDATNGWELWFLGSPGTALSNVTPHDSRWPKNSGGFLFSSDGGTIVTFPDHGVTADLWAEQNQAHTAEFTVPGSQDDDAALLGPGGRQLVVGAVTGGGFTYTKLYVYDIDVG